MVDRTELELRLAELRDAYRFELPDKLVEIDRAWQTVCVECDDSEHWRLLHRLVHSLSGSGATFGCPKLSDQARRFERGIQELITTGAPPPATPPNALKPLLEGLRSALQKAHASGDIDKNDISTELNSHVQEGDGRLIYLFEDDQDLAQQINSQLGYYGYEVRWFSDSALLESTLEQEQPIALIADIVTSDGSLAGVECVTRIQAARARPLQTVFISSRSDLVARLEAVRAGGVAYFTKPLDINALIDRLDEITASAPVEAYRILIIDDDCQLAEHYSLVLQKAGMETRVINEPLKEAGPFSDFAPDLILIDMYMPDCNGIELAAVIRMDAACLGVPIVFLSTETDINRQIKALREGGDDFLTKPIAPNHLVAAITSRVERSHVLQSLMKRDSLTGLLNHSSTKEELNFEVGRARRHNSILSFAMIDIDHFKQVNDTHGHQAGDQVIKNLARLLRQSLRATDIIGRIGGEEFAVVLPDTDAAAAWVVLDGIRDSFGKLKHATGRGDFSVSFSGGISELSQHAMAVDLAGAADAALYRAKSEGRNRIVLSSVEP